MKFEIGKISTKINRLVSKLAFRVLIFLVMFGLFAYLGSRMIPNFQEDYEQTLEVSRAYQVEVVVKDKNDFTREPMYLCLVSSGAISTVNIEQTISNQTSLVLSPGLTYDSKDGCDRDIEYVTVPIKY